MGIIERLQVEELAEGCRWLYTFPELNAKGEKIQVELTKCIPNNKNENSLPNFWKREGYKDRVLESYWCVRTYATDSDTTCRGRYNPTHKNNTNKADFDWVIEATEENRIKLLEEVERRAFMHRIKQSEWDKIPNDYKGEWHNYHNDHPEWLGRRVVMSGCVTEDPNEKGYLMIEGVHFEIVPEGV